MEKRLNASSRGVTTVNSQHIQAETLTKYLLGMLSEEEAEAIEGLYFTDSVFFQELRVAELQLICNYLDGGLSAWERGNFVSRYLKVERLRKLVEEVDVRRRASAQRASRRPLIRAALAAGLACVVILGVVITRYNRLRTSSRLAPSVSAVPHAAVTLFLSPGISKSDGLPTPALKLPDRPQRVVLVANLRGQASSASYTARISNLDVDEEHKIVWTAAGIRSEPSPKGQRVTLEIPSTSLSPGDYILELDMENGDVRESYVFRINPSQI